MKRALKKEIIKAIVEQLPRQVIESNREEINEVLEDVKKVNIIKEHWHYD